MNPVYILLIIIVVLTMIRGIVKAYIDMEQ